VGVIRVGPTRQRVTDQGRHRTWAKARVGDETRELWFETDADIPFLETNRGDLWVAPMMLLAMRRGDRLRLADPISAGRRPHLKKVQDIYCAWYPTRMARAKIVAPPPDEPTGPGLLRRRRDASDGRVAATTFTAGVDSFSSLVKHRKRLGALVYGFGLDVPSHEVEATERVAHTLELVARDAGIPLLTADTNLRRVIGKEVSWGFEGHGAVLASLGTVLSPLVSKLFVPSTYSYAVTHPWGSHPLVDPLWSTSRLQIVHEGAADNRVGKLKRIADEPLAQQHLRVCYKEFSDVNCGRCLKCMRTMVTLKLLDRLDRFETFHNELDVEHLSSSEARTENDIVQLRDAYEFATQVPGHDDIRDALGVLIDRYRQREIAGTANWMPGDTQEP